MLLHALTIRGRARWLDRQSAAWLTVVERPAVQHAALQLLSDSRFKVTVVDKALQESAGERGDYVIDIASAGVKHEDHGEQQLGGAAPSPCGHRICRAVVASTGYP